jgi:hypothetical protein
MSSEPIEISSANAAVGLVIERADDVLTRTFDQNCRLATGALAIGGMAMLAREK